MKQRLRSWLQDLLWAPGQQERQGVIALATLCVLSVLIPNIIQYRKDLADQRWLLALSAQQRSWMDSLQQLHPSKSDRIALLDLLGSFDPNEVDSAFWMKVGLGPELSQRIMNYRQAGGYFSQPSDLKKIYGLPEARYEELAPFIKIRRSIAQADSLVSKSSHASRATKKSPARNRATPKTHESRYPHSSLPHKININQASADELIKLRGIGPTLSQRAVRFRQQLGGFYSVDQFGEIYGLSDSVFQVIRERLDCSGELVQIAINHADSISLATHPYIAPWLAGQIVSRRSRIGIFQNAEDLLELKSMNRELLDRLLPYLLFEG